MSSDLKKFEERRKVSLFDTIKNTFWLWLDDLSRTMGFGKKQKTISPSTQKNQISIELDKYENTRIEKTKK